MKYKILLIVGFLLLITPLSIVYSQNETIYKLQNDTITIILKESSIKENEENLNLFFVYFVTPAIALISSLVGYGFKHFLDMRKDKLKLEIDVRRDVKDFFVQLYGHISILTELINAYHRALKSGTTRIINKEGFPELSKEEIYLKVKQRYIPYANFIWDGREKGIEIYFSEKLANEISDYYAYIDAFYNGKEFNVEQLKKFSNIAESVMKELEKTLGMPRKKIQI